MRPLSGAVNQTQGVIVRMSTVAWAVIWLERRAGFALP